LTQFLFGGNENYFDINKRRQISWVEMQFHWNISMHNNIIQFSFEKVF